MIPKKIHYCWFGGKEIPRNMKKYIEGWKKKCPDYDICEWNEANVDFSKCKYAKQAYEAKKWAFVSDYVRLKVLDLYGGIYLDTDVELLCGLDGIIDICDNQNCCAYFGVERKNTGDIAPGLGMGAEAGTSIVRELLHIYETFEFVNSDKNIVDVTTELFKTKGYMAKDEIQRIDGTLIFPVEYFNPTNMNSGKIELTENTISIHHYESSWVDGYSKFRGKVYKRIYSMFGEKTANRIRKVLGRKKDN